MIIACMKTFNGEDYIVESVASIYKHVDKIIIADCCFQSMANIVHPSRISAGGLSAPAARTAIKSLPDPDKKIEVWDVGFLNGDQTIIYTDFVSHADVYDTLWMIDDDEVYSEELASKLERWIREETYHAIWLPSTVFWHDFYHIRPDHGQLPHQRIYMKLDKSAHYVERNLVVRWNDDRGNIYGFGMPPKTTVYDGKNYKALVGDSSLAYHHYAYVRSVQRMIEKTVAQYIQNVEPTGGPEVEHCKRYRDPVEFKIETHSWFTNHDPEKVEKFSGSHPKLMMDHTWMKHTWNDERVPIDYEQAQALLASSLHLNTANIVEEEI